MATESYGTFVKDGRTKIARSRAAAVRFRFNGWAEQQGEPVTAVTAGAADASAEADPASATATSGASTGDSAFASAESSKPAPRRSDK